MSEVEIHDKSWLEIKQENGKVKETIEQIANEIVIEYAPHFASTETIRYCSAPSKTRETCQEEKMGCVGCYYYKRKEK